MIPLIMTAGANSEMIVGNRTCLFSGIEQERYTELPVEDQNGDRFSARWIATLFVMMAVSFSSKRETELKSSY